MFRSVQIITATELVKNLQEISRHLRENPAPLLITQRKGQHLAIMGAEFFEEILEENYRLRELGVIEIPSPPNPQTTNSI